MMINRGKGLTFRQAQCDTSLATKPCKKIKKAAPQAYTCQTAFSYLTTDDLSTSSAY